MRKQRYPYFFDVGSVNWLHFLEYNLVVSIEILNVSIFGPAISLIGLSPKEIFTNMQMTDHESIINSCIQYS